MRRRLAALLLALATTIAATACASGAGVLERADRPAATATSSPAATAPTASPTPPPTVGVAGAAGVGDPYFPMLGNGGYDVVRYELELDVSVGELDALVRIVATATEHLDTFNLDFARFEIERLEVDGDPALFRYEEHELVVDPEPVLIAGEDFVVEIRYRGQPQAMEDALLGSLGWQTMGDVTFVSDEPGGAHTWFPANDHPSDKASFQITMTVPEGITAVASGTLVSRSDGDGTSTWVWEHAEPIPTYVVAIAFGPLTLVESEGAGGVHIRHAFPPHLAERGAEAFATTADLITDLEGLFGPYPFATYGVLVVDGELGYAMENQTLALYPSVILDGSPGSTLTMVHELAHHWYGNWVTPATWQDIWLNEGFATYAEHLWLERTRPGYDIDRAMRDIAAGEYGPIGDPGPDALFSPAVYQRGALTLHALRRTMGDAGFFQLLRAWTDRFGGANASGEDLAVLASEVAGQNLHPFFDEWLFATVTPALPG